MQRSLLLRTASLRTLFCPIQRSSRPRLLGTSSKANSPRGAKKRRNPAIYIASALLAGGVFAWWDDKYNYRTVTRNFRTAYHGVMVAIDYKLNFDPDSLEAINSLHERSAARLLRVCEKNGGLYVKLAQAIATQGAFLPPPYMKLAKLLDDAEQFDYSVVEEIVLKELGAPIDELFVRFDRTPIAAASIAQVHRARIRLPSGEEEEVAVKVQRPDIRQHAWWDLTANRIMMELYEYFFDLPLSFGAQYISDQILQETLFDNEANNSEKIRSLILNSRTPTIRETCYVPRIHRNLSTPRIITMEYIPDACKLTDLKKIESMGLSVKRVAQSVSEVFAAQIFEMGFVQADGHPSNVLIRKLPNGKEGQHQVVLIDHGLYVSLSPDFRQKYSQLWYAIFVQDLPTIKRICDGWGIGQAELFASATLLRPWRAKGKMPGATSSPETSQDGAPGSEKQSQAEVSPKTKEQLQLEAQRAIKAKLKSFLLNVELLPKELIFVGRAMRIMQSNNQAMGSPVNRLNILAKHASAGLLRFVSSPEVTNASSTLIPLPPTSALKAYITSRISFLRFRFTLFVIDVAFYLTNWYAWIQSWEARVVDRITGADPSDGRRRAKRKFEDKLENELRDIARTKFGMQISEDAFES